MKKWEQAGRNFISSCSFKDDIEAVFLTGSHVFGNADEFSDIDLYIILNDNANWRERGNNRIDGFLIEYFANPMRQVKKYIDDSYSSVKVIEINMILGGIVIFNKNSAAEKMMDYCKQKSMSELPTMNEFNIKMGLYTLWDNLDELHRAYSRIRPDFAMQFFRFIQSAFELYSRYICSPIPSYHKMYRWLIDCGYSVRYGLQAYNDPAFLEIIRLAFECKDDKAMFDLSKDIYTYVNDRMGGIDIDHFVLRGPCDL